MPTYASTDDLISRFGEDEMSALCPAEDGIDLTKLAQHLSDADAQIDGHLAGRYGLPLAKDVPMLTKIACDLARYYMYDEAPTDVVTDRHKTAMSTLKGIASGAIRLPDTQGSEPAQGEAVVMSEIPARMFSGAKLEGF